MGDANIRMDRLASNTDGQALDEHDHGQGNQQQGLLSTSASNEQNRGEHDHEDSQASLRADRARPKRSAFTRLLSIPWIVELSTWAASLLLLITAIAVLAYFNHKPLPDLAFGITPAAIITLIATFFQVLLMSSVSSSIGQTKWLQALGRVKPLDDFNAADSASRGTMGSVKLILGRKGGYVIM